MSQQVKVGRFLEFEGDANEDRNVKGYMNPEKIFCEWNFQELALDTTNQYSLELDTDSTVASGSGGALMTTAATDTKVCIMTCGGLYWYPAKNPVMEVKLQLNVVTTVGLNVIWCDTSGATFATGELPFGINGTTISDTRMADGAGFCFDSRQDTDYFYAVWDKNGTQSGTILDSTRIPVAATDLTLRVRLDSSGNAYYYWNGELVYYKALAVTSTDPFAPLVAIRNNGNVAHVATVRYVRCWQDV